jgi:hypothetical protein
MNKTGLTEKQKAAMEAAGKLGFVAGAGLADEFRRFFDFCSKEIGRTGKPTTIPLGSGTTRIDSATGITEGISAELGRLKFLAFKHKKTKTRSQKEFGLRIKKEKWRHE